MLTNKTLFSVAAMLMVGLSHAAYAGTVTTVEGKEAEKLYASEKDKSPALSQANTAFIWREPGKPEVVKPASINVKAGQTIFLLNEEHGIVHNVYDNTDNSWVLQKQEPGKVAAISFSKPGEHKLRCAIHPLMKVTVNVTE